MILAGSPFTLLSTSCLRIWIWVCWKTHPDHDFYQLFSEPSNVGFCGVARYRTWVIGAHRRHTVCLFDPFELQDMLTTAFQQHVKAEVPDFLVASTAEIQLEASVRATHRQVPYKVGCEKDLQYLLSPREEECRRQLDVKFLQKYGMLPGDHSSLVYYLGDSADYCTWSASSQKIPTYRLNAKNAVYWLPKQKRWLTAKERLCFPCTTEIAGAMQVPLLGATDIRRAADLCGNSMHFTTCGIMQLIALSCFGPKESAFGSPDGQHYY